MDNGHKIRSAYFAKLISPRTSLVKVNNRRENISIHARNIKNWIFCEILGTRQIEKSKWRQNWCDATRRDDATYVARRDLLQKLNCANFQRHVTWLSDGLT